ncbi:MAG: type I-C CRISPR-associated protein Cas7/Csd2 [Acidobacteria bacterium]|nr:type I-C CRISPR-associated protein Cas7/Csd2 [Acidobacteriota bacterium]
MSTTLQNKIDFAVVLRVKNANPNGDPLNGNRPRTDYRNYGEISDVAIKRKIRNRLLDEGEAVFVQSDDRKNDNAGSLRERADANLDMKKKPEEIAKQACAKWLDVRAFGQLLAFKSKKKTAKKGEAAEGDEGDGGVSIGIRGPVSVQPAFSVEPIEVSSTQITKSVSGEGTGEKRGSDTMGMKHRVDGGVYTFFGSMNPQLAERTGFSDKDADAINNVLPKLFENDESSARPAGSMEVLKVYWWKHNSKSGQYSSAKVHATLKVNPDGSSSTDDLPGLKPDIIDGF